MEAKTDTRRSSDMSAISKLAEKKEKELNELKSLQLATLNKELQEKDKLLQLERKRFHNLKDDFEYNLKIIEQRDEELRQYEKAFMDVKERDIAINADISDAKIKIEDMKSKLEQTEKQKIELEEYYRKRTNDMQKEMNKFFAEKTSEFQKEKDEYLKYKRNADRKIQDAENEMEAQKRQQMFEFDEEMKKKETEFRMKFDELRNILHTKELHVKMVTKELELLRENGDRQLEQKTDLDDQVVLLKKELQKKDWDIKDVENMMQIRLMEMKQKFDSSEKEKQNMRDEFSRTCANLDKLNKDKDQQFIALQQEMIKNEQSLKNEIEQLKQTLGKSENKLKQTVWDFNDRINERDVKLQNLQLAFSDLETKAKHQQGNLTQALVARDLEIETLRSSLHELSNDNNKLRTDLKKLQNENTFSSEKEKVLEQAKEQLELDWQKRYEEASMNAEMKYRGLVDKLNGKIIAVNTELDAKQKELSQREQLIKVLKKDKDIAFTLLKRNGIDLSSISGSFDELVFKEELDGCREENEQLRSIINLMRKEIEAIESKRRKDLAGVEYVKDLEEQVKDLKTDNRKLQANVDELNDKVIRAEKQKRVSFLGPEIAGGGSRDFKLQAKLKSAASQIQSLMMERDRLLNLGNKLRAEISQLKIRLKASEEFRPSNVESDKEGHLREVSLKVAQRKFDSGLKNLEDAQYELMMEKMREKPKVVEDIDVRLVSSNDSSADSADGGMNVAGDSVGEQFVEHDQDIESNFQSQVTASRNVKSSTPTQEKGERTVESQRSNSKVQQNVASSSELSSLQDLWKLLDEAESLASQTPRNLSSRGVRNEKLQGERDIDFVDLSSGKVEIAGQQLQLRQKEDPKEPKLSKMAKGKFVPLKKVPIIRNYNVKDD
eukprot:Seg1949.1 transcript_id=Seg1949.1/GoldUCD/mRNA.D3Y31 product="Coiled-coil domain-containing protein 57" protein_id=Seg1949.1/GoldUCD/D3Y31